MKPLQSAPSLVEQVHRSILSSIASGQLRHGERIIQEQLAHQLGISRQPVQQALTLLRKEGVLIDAPGRGLQVAPLDLDHVRHMYEVRAVIEGLAFRNAAERNARAAAHATEGVPYRRDSSANWVIYVGRIPRMKTGFRPDFFPFFAPFVDPNFPAPLGLHSRAFRGEWTDLAGRE